MSGGALGSLVVSLEANIAQFTKAMEQAEFLADKMSRGVTAKFRAVDAAFAGFAVGAGNQAFTAITDALEQLGPAAIKAAANLERLRETVGGTVENLSALTAVAKLSDTSFDQLQMGLTKLAKGMVSSGDTTKGAGAAFAALGISVRDAAGQLKPTDAMMVEIAKRMDEYSDGAGKAAAAQLIFGKAGAQLLPMLHDLADAGELVGKVTADQARQADELEKDLVRLRGTKQALVRTIAMELVPAMDDLVRTWISLTNAQGGARDQITGMAKDGTLAGWADTSATSLAFVVDTLRMLGNTVMAIGSSFAVVLADIGVAIANVARIALASLPGLGKALVDLAEGFRDSVLQQATERWTRLMEMNTSAVRDNLSAQQALRAFQNLARASVPSFLLPDGGDRPGLNVPIADTSHSVKQMSAAFDLLDRLASKADGFSTSFYKDMGILHVAFTTGAIGLQTYTAALMLLTSQEKIFGEALDHDAAYWAHRRDLMRDQVKAITDVATAQDDVLNALEDEGRKLESEIATMGMSTAERDKYNLALKTELELKKLLGMEGLTDDEADKIRARVLARQQETAGLIDQAAALKTQQAIWQDIGQRAGAFFADVIVNGANAFDRLRQELKRFAADLISLFAQRWILQLGAALTGSSSLGAAAGQVGANSVTGAIGSGITSWLGSTALGSSVSGAGSSFALGLQGGTMTGGTATMQAANSFGVWLNGAAGVLGYFAIALAGAAVAAHQYAAGWRLSNGAASNTSGAPGALVMPSLMDRTYRALGFNDQWAAILSGSSMATRMFGRRERTNDAFGVTGNVSGSGVTGQNWQDWSRQGGWFSSTQRGTDVSALSTDQSAFFAGIMGGLGTLVGSIASQVGVNAAGVNSGFHRDFNFQLNNDGKPLTDDEVNTLIGNFFGSVLQEQTAAVLDAAGRTRLADYVRDLKGSGDQITATIAELSDVMAGVTHLGAKGLSVESLMDWEKNGESLGQAWQRVSTQFAQFNDAFMTDAQKFDAATLDVSNAFAAIGVAVPENSQAFYDLVHGLDLSTEAGRKMFDALMAIAPEFQSVQNAAASMVNSINASLGQIRGQGWIDNVNQGKLDAALDTFMSHNAWTQGQSRDQIMAALLTITPQDMAAYIGAGQGGNLNDIFALYAGLHSGGGGGGGTVNPNPGSWQTGLDAAAQAARDLATALANARQGIGDWLAKTLLNPQMTTLTPFEQLSFAHDRYVDNLMKARGGDVGALSNFSSFADDYLREARGYYASGADYAAIFAAVTNQASGLATNDVRPLTALDAKQGFGSVVDELKAVRATVRDFLVAMIEQSGMSMEQQNAILAALPDATATAISSTVRR